MPMTKANRRIYERERYRLRKATGVCVKCVSPQAPDSMWCVKCREYERARCASRQSDALERGECVHWGCRAASYPGSPRCEVHREEASR